MKPAATTAALLLSTLSCVGQTTLKEVLSWLPPDTESVVGANGPFSLPDHDELSPGDLRQPELPVAELELRARTLVLGLFGFKNGGLQKDLEGKAVALAVEGSRHFRPPAALGGMRYEGCEIVVFGPAISLDRDSFMRNAAKSATRFEDVAGVRIAVFEEPQENDVWTTFVGFPRSNIVVVATDAEYLRTVLARMKGSSGPRALPDTLVEWRYVNTRAPVWGLRHYQTLEASLDPTSPFSGQGDAGDAMAVGLAFSFDTFVRRMVTVSYLSANNKARQMLEDYLGVADADTASPREFQIRLRQPALGVIEGSVTLSLKEMFYRFLFGLMGMLGHAVYL
jgi:hypothetical protein